MTVRRLQKLDYKGKVEHMWHHKGSITERIMNNDGVNGMEHGISYCTTCLVLAADRGGNDFCIILHKYSASGINLGF